MWSILEQPCVEISETPVQSREGKIGAEVLLLLVKPDIVKLLLQTLLSILTQMLLQGYHVSQTLLK